tara:strand:- start:499 stop:1233 length:735 start_codon:yes stop_codon:yes gene_type:complete
LSKLYKGDCLEVMKSIHDGSVDAIITDPPYGTTACKWDSVIPFEPLWEQLNRIIKPNGAIVLFGSEPFSSALRMSNIKNYKYDIIWEKPNPSNPLLAKKRFMSFHENISIFYKKAPTYNPQKVKRLNKDKRKAVNKHFSRPDILGGKVNIEAISTDSELKHPSSVLKHNRQQGLHPTQKPISLMEILIKTYTNENETVLDFTMGSGSTGVAAKNTNRNFIGIEQDEKYFKIAEQRIKETEYKLF